MKLKFSQAQLVAAICLALDDLGQKALNQEQINAVILAANEIMAALQQEEPADA